MRVILSVCVCVFVYGFRSAYVYVCRRARIIETTALRRFQGILQLGTPD